MVVSGSDHSWSRPQVPTGSEIDYTLVPTVWQRPFMQNVLPLVTSCLLHAGLIVLGLAAATAVGHITEVRKAQIVIPTAEIVDGAEVGMPAGGAPGMLLQSTASELNVQDVTPQANRSALDGLPGVSADTGALIGVGKLNLPGASGLRDGGRGPGSPFGLPVTSGAPTTEFIGAKGNARRVVFLCDASGTMLSSFPMLRRELQATIASLQPTQSFNVVFFQDAATDTIEGLPPQAVAASQRNKQLAYKWINEYIPQGATSPFAAITKAFAMEPDLVFVLTDGFDNVASYKQVRDAFDKANPTRRTKVMTLLLEGASDPELAKLLQDVAADHGGVARVVRPN